MPSRTKSGALALAAGVAMTLAWTLPAGAAETTIKLGWATTDAEKDAYAYAAREFKRLLEEAKPDQFEVKLFPNRQLGDEKEMVQGMQLGTVDAGIITNSVVANVVPEFQVNDLPFLYTSREQAHAVLDGKMGQKLLGKLEAKDMVGLAFCESGFRNMINNARPVKQPTDVEGVKYRVMESPIFIGMYDNLGGSAVPMAWGDTFTAVQQGTVDGLEIPTWVIEAAKLYEVTDYLSLTQHVYTAAPLLVSKKTYDSLSAENQKLLQETAATACENQRTFNAETEQEIIATLKEKGMEVNDVASPAAFQDQMQPIYDEYRPKIGAEFMDQWMAALEN